MTSVNILGGAKLTSLYIGLTINVPSTTSFIVGSSDQRSKSTTDGVLDPWTAIWLITETTDSVSKSISGSTRLPFFMAAMRIEVHLAKTASLFLVICDCARLSGRGRLVAGRSVTGNLDPLTDDLGDDTGDDKELVLDLGLFEPCERVETNDLGELGLGLFIIPDSVDDFSLVWRFWPEEVCCFSSVGLLRTFFSLLFVTPFGFCEDVGCFAGLLLCTVGLDLVPADGVTISNLLLTLLPATALPFADAVLSDGGRCLPLFSNFLDNWASVWVGFLTIVVFGFECGIEVLTAQISSDVTSLVTQFMVASLFDGRGSPDVAPAHACPVRNGPIFDSSVNNFDCPSFKFKSGLRGPLNFGGCDE